MLVIKVQLHLHIIILILTPFPTVAQVLHCCVSGSIPHTQQSHYLLSLSDLSADYNLMLGQVKSSEPPPSQTTTSDFGNLLTVAEGKEDTSPCHLYGHSGRAGDNLLLLFYYLLCAQLHWAGSRNDEAGFSGMQ